MSRSKVKVTHRPKSTHPTDVCKQPKDSAPLPSGKDPFTSEPRLYATFLDDFVKSSSKFTWRYYVKLNACQDTRPGDRKYKIRVPIYEPRLKSVKKRCSALSTVVLLILLPLSCKILLKITLNKILLASYLFAPCLQVVQNKLLHSESWHKLLDFSEVLNLYSFCILHFAATTG